MKHCCFALDSVNGYCYFASVVAFDFAFDSVSSDLDSAIVVGAAKDLNYTARGVDLSLKPSAPAVRWAPLPAAPGSGLESSWCS